LSPIFVKTPTYGTRTSTVVILRSSGSLVFRERSFDFQGKQIGDLRHVIAAAK
jgi:uncharacterized protein with NRDE domain